MEKWYKNLKSKLQINATGIVGNFLKAILANDLAMELPQAREIDSNISADFTTWFNGIFSPWFAQLSATLNSGNTLEELTAVSYTTNINNAIKALWVAKSYYSKQADAAFVTSLQTVELYKAALCEEIARSLDLAYEEALRQYGTEIEGKDTTTTIASTYKGTTPENFKWNGDVLVNHVVFENVKVTGISKPRQSKSRRERKV